MSFQNPNALWGLLSLLVPITIHLFNANRGRRVPFGDTRFIEPAQARQMRSVFLTELPLLALRCVLLALLCAYLARPEFDSAVEFRGDVAVLISPLALENAGDSARVTAREIARQNGADLRLLARGFPRVSDLDQSPPVNGGAFSLLAELEHGLPNGQQVVMLVSEDPRESGWRLAKLDHPLQTIELVPGARHETKPLTVVLRSNADRRIDRDHVLAGLNALIASGMSIELVDPESTDTVDIAIALGDVEPGQARLLLLDAGTTSGFRDRVMTWQGLPFDVRLIERADPGASVIEDNQGVPLARIRQAADHTELRWLSRFRPDHAAVVADGSFPDLLESLILAGLPELAGQASLVPTHTEEFPRQPAKAWALLIGLVFLGERWLSGYRRTRHVRSA